MKKSILVLLVLTLIFSLTACSKLPEKEISDNNNAKNDNSDVTIENPVTELTEDKFVNIYGAYYLPEGSENPTFSQIKVEGEDEQIAEIDFTRFDNEYCFRYFKGEEQDISGLFYDIYDVNKQAKTDLEDGTCQIKIVKDNDKNVGAATWYDKINKINYAIIMEEGATEDLLISTFNQYYGYYCRTFSCGTPD